MSQFETSTDFIEKVDCLIRESLGKLRIQFAFVAKALFAINTIVRQLFWIYNVNVSDPGLISEIS